MKGRSYAVGGLLAGAMLVADSAVASANLTWCMFDPPIQVVTPGGHHLVVNNYVYLPASAAALKDQVTDDASVAPDGHGGTRITVHVHVPASIPAHVVSAVNRYHVTDEKDGVTLITLHLDVPTT